MFDNFVSALSSQFRQQYPQGSIISDLVQIHGDQYVVKVSISLEKTVLVSTLAADANLLIAESQAMARALTILGIRDLRQPADEPVNLIEEILIEEKVPVSPVLTVVAAEPITTQVETTSEISDQRMKFNPEPSLSEPNIELDIPASDPLPAATVAELPLDQAREPITEPALSVTDMIPMINMELKRLGWSKERGREYMVSLYNKRASALLSDDELLGLLQHLQAEPIV